MSHYIVNLRNVTRIWYWVWCRRNLLRLLFLLQNLLKVFPKCAILWGCFNWFMIKDFNLPWKLTLLNRKSALNPFYLSATILRPFLIQQSHQYLFLVQTQVYFLRGCRGNCNWALSCDTSKGSRDLQSCMSSPRETNCTMNCPWSRLTLDSSCTEWTIVRVTI